MAEKAADLNAWLKRAQASKDARELFSMLDEFRKQEWSDDDRARMAKTYMRVLERVGPPPEEADVVEETKNDGPVWYEKM